MNLSDILYSPDTKEKIQVESTENQLFIDFKDVIFRREAL